MRFQWCSWIADTLNDMLDENLEVEEYWDRYAELSTREQIRDRGFISWACNTNKGVLTAFVVQFAVAVALVTLLS